MNQDILRSYKILDGEDLSMTEILALSKIGGEDLLDLVSLSYKVQKKYSPSIHLCTISNAKSGLCSENCSFCAQSSFHHTDIATYPLLSFKEIFQQAEKAYQNGIRHFGIVTSGYGYQKVNEEFQTILHIIEKVKKDFPDMEICASLGVLSEETAELLVRAGIVEYNHNLQVNPEKYSTLISSTHSINERIQTIKILKKYPVRVCSGGILGVGETMEDRIKLAFLLKNLNVDIIPLNVLIPIKGTKLEGQQKISPLEVVKTFALFRLIVKDKVIKFAAGRETIMKDFQGLIMLAGANGFLTGGYLTTKGRRSEDDKEFLEALYEFQE
ncbi:biotin synthase BioB [Thermospira aquatica]|uniref:Biotin synthase n=1 Tax=Thermospira aquatica TaxID=2828656 RepID=A0AAX3BAD3_9SPIR|nr:biotin synthase BioB [Thermospira aquatica]URA09215.1 biotin synthase BioB [Thermospira aquatica]